MEDRPRPPEDIPAVSAEDLVDGDESDEGRRYPSTIGGLFYLAILLVALLGLVLVVVWEWRRGIEIVGGAMIAAALIRLVLPAKDAGMLAVRNRFLDALLLSGCGAALIFLAVSIPNQPVV